MSSRSECRRNPAVSNRHYVEKMQMKKRDMLLNSIPIPLMIMQMDPKSNSLITTHINTAAEEIFPRLATNEPHASHKGLRLD